MANPRLGGTSYKRYLSEYNAGTIGTPSPTRQAKEHPRTGGNSSQLMVRHPCAVVVPIMMRWTASFLRPPTPEAASHAAHALRHKAAVVAVDQWTVYASGER